MGRKHKKGNPFAARKRELREGPKFRPDKRSEPYKDIVRDNEQFIKYYQQQHGVVPADQWDAFLSTIRADLPTTFRITAFRDEAQTLLNIVKSQCFNSFVKGSADVADDGEPERRIAAPFALPWYPDGLAWQLELTRKDIRRSEAFYKLHNFLIAETSAGSISRQEAVSMIPPIVLDVQPHHKVLDMCAAPGSKTAQLIEYLHAGSELNGLPSGFVVANDVDNDRCYMLVHQAKRLNSPCFVVTNHDSSAFPNIRVRHPETGAVEALRFDRVLCDVPCSGDGTLRKNPDIWQKWNNAQSANLHGIQYRIAKRGAELLAVGGRLVYSTCSMNPIENEAVLHRLLREAEGALEIVDAGDLVPGLQSLPGLSSWRPASKDIEFYESFEQVPERLHTVIRPQMFPPTPDEAGQFNLQRCIRILPHLQNTGGFFVAALVKHRRLPWEKEPKADERPAEVESAVPADGDVAAEPAKVSEAPGDKRRAESDAKAAAAPWGPQRKRKRVTGFKEDPYVFFGDEEPAWLEIRAFYGLSDAFNPRCLLTRSVSDKKRNIYFVSEAVRDIVLLNEDAIKMINTGVKTFVRCDNRNMRCSYRLANEGLPSINHLMGATRRLTIGRDDLIVLLQNNTPVAPPLLTTLSEQTQRSVEDFGAGSCVLRCVDGELALTLVGWRGTTSLRAYTDTNDTVHMLRLLGADLSKYDVNKFQKKAEAEEAEKQAIAEAELADESGESNGRPTENGDDEVPAAIAEDVLVES